MSSEEKEDDSMPPFPTIISQVSDPQSGKADGATTPRPPHNTSTGGASKGFREHRVVKVSRNVLIGTYIFLLALFAVMVWQLVVLRAEPHVYAWCVAALFVGIAVPLSLHDMYLHAMHYVCPELQKYYVRCLFMVPIYSIESWMALRFQSQNIFLETAREAYEAYVIYSVLMLLINYLGGGVRVREILKTKYDAGHTHSPGLFPLCWWKWKMSGQLIHRCVVAVFQYVIIRFFFAWIYFIMAYSELHYETHSTTYKAMERAISIIILISQMAALYGLIMFYVNLSKELDGIAPLGKLMVVKSVVFFSFWQGFLIKWLGYDKRIKPAPGYTTDDTAAAIQDFLICCEMAFAAVAHKFFFHYKDMERIMDVSKVEVLPFRRAVYDLLPWDVVTEFRAQLGGGFGLVHKRQKMRTAGGTCMTPPRSPIPFKFPISRDKATSPPSSLAASEPSVIV